ncbi:MAG: GEVED domain-containing protein [Xanthomonadaceae bacterium]|jgi:uncharacterized repeat protein (TIGR01451 family)|nr:GEVED domain-containing protein [Xanthomonadaceae bacterium]
MSTRLLAAFAATMPMLFALPAAAQDPDFQLTKQLVTPAAGSTVPPGTPVRYRITYRCNGLVATTCGSLAFADTLPPQLEIVGCDFPGFAVSACTPGGATITANRAVLNAGTTGEGFIDTRVRPGAGPATNVTNTAQGTISLPSTNPPQPMPVVAVSPPINISGASQRSYNITKTRIDPIQALVISDQATFVTDRVRFCATSGVDLVDLGGATIYDDLPSIATNIRTAVPGGTPPISESIAGNRVTWTIPPERLDVDVLYPPGSNLGAPSCFDFFVTYDLPAGAVAVPDRAHVRTPDPTYCAIGSLGVPPPGDTANPQCFGATTGIRGAPQSILTPFAKTGNDATPSDTPNDLGIGRINWRLAAGFESNVGLRNVSFYDILPLPESGPGGTTLPRLDVTAFAPGNWASAAPVYEVVADVYVTTVDPAPEDGCGGAGWTALGTGILGANSAVFTTGLAGATGFCWSFRNALPSGPATEVPRDFAFTTQPRVTQAVPASIVPPALPDALEPDNCFRARWTAGTPQTQRLCRTQRIERPRPGVDPVKAIQSAPSPLRPLDTIVFRVGVDHTAGDSTGDIVDPVIVDLLPPELEYLSFAVVQPGAPVPVVTTVANFNGVANQTLVRIAYSGTFPRNFAQMPRVDLTTRVRAFTGDGTYTNRVSVFENGVPPRTCAATEVADADDRDGDGNTTELRCERSISFVIAEAAVLDGSKWVAGTGPVDNPADPLVDDPTEPPSVLPAACPTFSQAFGAGTGDGFSRFPCVARTRGYGDAAGGRATWRIRVQNAGNVAYDNYVLYDVLPFVGDTGVGEPLVGQQRNTDFRPQLLGPPAVVPSLTSLNLQGAGVFTIEYSGASNACRPEVSSDDDTSGWQGACTNDWATTPPGGSFANVRAIRIRAFVDPNGSNPVNWGVGDVVVFEVPLEVPATTPRVPPSVVGSAAVFNVAWGSFAHRAYRAVTGAALDPINLLPTAEPPKVGFISPERYRLGNLVWRDVNDNGTSQVGEPGIDGVAVRLCRDDDGSAGPSAGDATVGTTTTATIGSQAGKYLFEVLERRTDYYVAIAAGQPALAGLQVSAVNGLAPGNNVDNDNNAQLASVAAACGGGAAFVSSAFDLGTPSNFEPTNETIRSGSGTDDDPNNGTGSAEPWPDGMSNYSVDFGFSATGSTEDDLGDLPDTTGGTGAGNYQTLLVNNGPSHVRTPGLTIGTVWDSELDGQPNAGADGDDANPSGADDEDGVVTPAQLRFFRGQPGVLDVRVVNTTATAARLCGFLDLNSDGDFADAGEVAPAVAVPASGPAGGTVVQLNFGTIPAAGLNIDLTYVRLRLTNTVAGACAAAFANGPAASGEVEDYRGAVIAEDRGDLPDGLGGAPSYPTLNANNGAVHVISSANTFLGASVDAEPQGQPTLAANGDDTLPTGQPDDEDGITFPTPIVAGRASSIVATAGVAGRLNCWFDYNANGTLGDTVGGQPEQFANELAINAGANVVALTPPFAIARGNYYLRCRFSTGTGQGNLPTGSAPNGEVEDYLVRITQPDLGDLPDAGPGVGAGNYETLRAAGGAEHPIFDLPGATLRLGGAIDAEADGQPSAGADGDDLAGDDEDGITVANLTMTAATAATVSFSATNTLALPASVCGFIDFNGDGDFADAGESAQAAVPAGSNPLAGTLAFAVPATAVRDTYARFRISTAPACAPNGLAPDGDVEDYRATIIAFDLGDLPNGSGAGLYPTLRSASGPRHEIVPGLRLGAVVDAEGDGQPNVGASGDDLAGPAPDDEDGVTFDPLNLGSPGRANLSVLNSTGGPATLCVFVDWNNDGDFGDTFTITTPGGGTTAETIAQSVPSAAAVQNLVVQLGIVPPPGTVGVPPTGAVLQPYARVRLSTTPGFTCTAGDAAGPSPNGEVEDYRVGSTTGAGLMSLGDLVFEDRNNNCVHDAGEPGVGGVAVSVFRDADNDNLPDGPAVSTQNTTPTGGYLFTNLVPDNYRVAIVRPARYIGSTGSLPYTGSGACEPAADPDTDTVNSRDKGTGAGTAVTEIVSRSVTLDPKGEPDDGTNGYWRVDFGLVPNFDLALRKALAPGQPTVVTVGASVDYRITVSNEGTIAATAITIVDRIPTGMTLDDAAWTAGPGNTATRTIAGPLAPGASATVGIRLRVASNLVPTFVNRAEIRDARDDGNNPVRDIDSVPDDGQDGQDDIDDVQVTQPISIPAGNAMGWLLLALLVLLGGALTTRRRFGA